MFASKFQLFLGLIWSCTMMKFGSHSKSVEKQEFPLPYYRKTFAHLALLALNILYFTCKKILHHGLWWPSIFNSLMSSFTYDMKMKNNNFNVWITQKYAKESSSKYTQYWARASK